MRIYKRSFTHIVTEEEASNGLSIKKLMDIHFDFSSRLRTKIKQNDLVTVNGKHTPLWIPPAAGDEIVITLPPEKSTFEPQDIPLDIIYEDDKTTNYLSDPTDIDYDTLPDGVLELLVEVNDDGTEVSITNPEIKKILEGPYTVTYKYNGSVFGTQTVKKGEKAVEPSLKPAESGSWNFDFNKPIMRNTIVEWK